MFGDGNRDGASEARVRLSRQRVLYPRVLQAGGQQSGVPRPESCHRAAKETVSMTSDADID